DVFAADCAVIMPAANLVIAEVHPSLLLLTQSVVVLVGLRIKCGRNSIAFRARLSPFRMLWRHHPATHVHQDPASGRCHLQLIIMRPAICSTSEVLVAQLIIEVVQRHRSRSLFLREVPWGYTYHQSR